MKHAALFIALACAAATIAAAPPPTVNSNAVLDSPGNYRIETDVENANVNTGAFTMPHKVKFTRPGTDATADRAEGNYKQGTAILVGNVVVHDSGNAPEAGPEEAYKGNGPATLTCDRLEVDSKAKTYTAIGNVHFTQGTRTGTSERGVLNRGNNTMLLEGNVKLTDAESSMTANTVNYNLQTKDVQVSGAPVIIKQPVPPPAPGTPGPSPTPKKKK